MTLLEKSPHKTHSYTFQGKLVGKVKKPKVSLSFVEGLFSLSFSERSYMITPTQLQGWEFCDTYAFFNFLDENGTLQHLCVELKPEEARYFQKEFQKYRIDYWFNSLSSVEKEKTIFVHCPACRLLVAQEKAKPQSVVYCPECSAMFKGTECITEHRGVQYNFCLEGFFLELWPHRNAEKLARIKANDVFYSFDSLYFKTKGYLNKLLSHSLWIVFWGVLAYVTSLIYQGKTFDSQVLQKASISISLVSIGLIFFHLFMIGSYHSYLMMRKALSKFFRPGVMEKKLRLAVKGEESLYLKEKVLLEHPGGLFNLGMMYAKNAKRSKAKKCFSKCVSMCPNHPYLRMVHGRTLTGSTKKAFKEECLKIFARNLFLPLKEMRERVELHNL